MPFRDISGHRRTLALLTGSVALRTLPPSLIFSGIAGIGKRRTAVALAQTLNCPSPRRDVRPQAAGQAPSAEVPLPIDACGDCPSCRRIARLVHPDVIVIVPDEEKGNIRVNEIRQLNERLGYRPFEGRWRVVIIDEAETLETSAQNALLKALEEPPSSSIFVLVTARPDGLLDTVRSRCPVIRFGPLPIEEVALVLQQAHGLDAAEAQALAAVSGGSVGAALDTASASLAAARAAVERLLNRLAASPDVRVRLQAAGEITGKGAKESGASARDALATHLRALHAMLRDIGVVSALGTDRAVANIDRRPVLARLAPSFDRERLLRGFSAIDQALTALDGNANPKIVADWVALRL